MASLVWPVILGGCGRSSIALADGSGDAGGSGVGHDDDDDSPVSSGDGGNGHQTCREVDFLFLIDDSPSMAVYQSRLLANYGVFIDGIQDAIQSIQTTHVGVITAEPYAPNTSQCDQLGGLVVQTGGEGSSNATCGPFKAGDNFMTGRDKLEIAFSCAANVGTGGTDRDLPMGAILSAVSPPLTDPGQCNHGFLGEGALLVVVIVTDNYPNESGVLDIDPFFASVGVVDAVGGFDDVVVVVIASTEESPCLNPLNPALEQFASVFDYSYIGAICEYDYSKIFGPATEVVKDACPQPG